MTADYNFTSFPPEAGFGRGWYETNWYLQIYQYLTGIGDMMGLIIKNLTQTPWESSRSEVIEVIEMETKEKKLASQLKFVTFFPAGAGTFMALSILLIQYWKWFQGGEWRGMPLAEFVPQTLFQWAVTKEGGLLGLKEIVLAALSIHASVWFFVTGCVFTFILFELTKPLLKD